jgi:hypothetical protein
MGFFDPFVGAAKGCSKAVTNGISALSGSADNILSAVMEKKDNVVSSVIEQKIVPKANRFLEKYGAKIVNLTIDSQSKKATLDLELKGEKEAITVTVSNYELLEQDDGAFLKVKDITTSREWINELIKNYLFTEVFPGKMIPIPPLPWLEKTAIGVLT